ncbi:MAG: GldG family protein [Cystobacter sp.]
MATQPSLKVVNLGRILGGLGLLLLLSSPFTLFITSGSFALFATKALAGLAFLAVFFATNFRRLGQFGSKRSSFFFGSTALMLVLVLLALGAVNYIAYARNVRWDLTDRKIFTLSPQTVSTLQDLPEPVRAIAFLAPDHPAREALRTTFERYRVEAPERFSYAFEDPLRRPDLTQKYELRGGQTTTVVLVRGQGDKETHTSLNVISEQDLTNALIQLSRQSDQRVYFVIGHGEWPLDRAIPRPGQQGRTTSLSEMRRQLTREGYASREINLGGGTPIPRDAALLVVAGAKAPFNTPEVAEIRRYLEAGGRMIFFTEVYSEPGPDMRALLAEYGVGIDPGVVADAQFNGGSPYLIVSLFFGDHDISRLLRQRQLNIELPTARGLTLLESRAPGVKAETVLRTSPYAWEETAPDENPAPTAGERTGQISLVTASSRDTSSAPNKRFDESRLVVVGDSELLFDSNWGHEGNRNLVMNAFGWVTHQSDKLTIRPPDRATSTLTLDATLLERIRFLSTDVLPLSLLGVGLAIWLSRRNK